MHHSNGPIRSDTRPARCLRHHVWMAACDDCHEAHAALLARGRSTSPRPVDQAA
ncbi:hypothetical protein [Geodermatophilus sp. TF02-6]|uniref:hypothetical protein n=1 Tax=Geodermatophilus sp. TF02-6 TaxID=2250575 RepID=UPI00131410B7|nr:hypothetical protein [Geodermatophilus sp. TF02-6]